MKLTNEWFSTLAVDENNNTVYVNGRLQLSEFIAGGKYKHRIEIRFPYGENRATFPEGEEAKHIEAVEELLQPAMEKDKMAILTGNYLAPGCKYWVYYSRTDRVFFERLNTVLASLPLLPLEFTLELDPQWEEYLDLLTLYDESNSDKEDDIEEDLTE